MSGARWPNLFLVGVGKGGTSSLWDHLAQHPEIYMSPLKEPHFFIKRPEIEDEAAYLRLFAGAGDERYVGEASISYFWDPVSPAAIRRASPDAKAIVILRDPVERAHSHYWHAVRAGRETRSFLEALEDEFQDRRPVMGGRRVEPYARRGSYVGPLGRYLDAFGEDLIVLFFEALVADPRRELRRLFELLELDPAPADQIRMQQRNPFSLPRNTLARRLLTSARWRQAGRRLVPRQLRTRVEETLLVRQAKPEMEPRARAVLERFYEGDRDPLEALLGRPLPWPAYGSSQDETSRPSNPPSRSTSSR
jgi:Sulfotransferase family